MFRNNVPCRHVGNVPAFFEISLLCTFTLYTMQSGCFSNGRNVRSFFYYPCADHDV